jgi:hypothetical protein
MSNSIKCAAVILASGMGVRDVFGGSGLNSCNVQDRETARTRSVIVFRFCFTERAARVRGLWAALLQILLLFAAKIVSSTGRRDMYIAEPDVSPKALPGVFGATAVGYSGS